MFSAIIPVKDSSATLESCILHLRAQTEKLDKIIVIDNGSRDNSVEIAESYADIVLKDPCAKISTLRNIGAANADSDFLLFVDSDCLLHEFWVAEALEIFQDSDVAMVGCNTHTLPESSGWVARAWKMHLDSSSGDILGAAKEVEWLVTRSLAVRSDVFEEVGGFDESKVTCEDVDLGYRVSGKYKVISHPKLSPLHLDDAESLGELFRKERWRGRDSFAVSLRSASGELKIKEVISRALPFYFLFFGVSFLGLFLWFIAGGLVYVWPLVMTAVFLIAPILCLSLKLAFQFKALAKIPEIFLVYSAYIFGRVMAFTDFMFRQILEKKAS